MPYVIMYRTDLDTERQVSITMPDIKEATHMKWLLVKRHRWDPERLRIVENIEKEGE